MKPLSFIPSFLRNKFLLTALAFGVWMIFFDKNDLLIQKERNNELQALQESKVYFQKEIEKERKFSQELKTNPAAIEKFAREKYLMTKDGEDLFIVKPLSDGKNGEGVAQ
jgi:cell division protein FtsB